MKIYTITAKEIADKVRELALNANMYLPDDMKKAIAAAHDAEKMPRARGIYEEITKNYELAAQKYMPICQDCGLAVTFIKLGQDLHITGGTLEDAVNEGIRSAYRDGCLRKSVVADPLKDRKNTGDNTPAVIHLSMTEGHTMEITVAPKGMGSENMSKIFMLKPADGAEGVIKAAVDTVNQAGSNPCPPIVLGIGIGGNFETAPLTAKEALLVPSGKRNEDKFYAEMEERIISEANALGIGPAGIGGTQTVLDAHILTRPTHIAGMPVAINICCHALRHAHGIIEGRD
ncbi:MAG: fumarate hydratase [Synergistes sp.]|nr:fumarate hydratase [Synergistes sp.]